MKDKKGKNIRNGDIVSCNGLIGWVWTYQNEFQVAWDLEGLSCEDSTPLKDFTNKFDSIQIIGMLK
jgi:hypothetical protein